MLEFAWPWLFALLPLPILAWWWLPFARQAWVQVPFLRPSGRSDGADPAAWRRGVAAEDALQMVLAALPIWILLVAALARPQWVGDAVTREVSGT